MASQLHPDTLLSSVVHPPASSVYIVDIGFGRRGVLTSFLNKFSAFSANLGGGGADL